MERSRHDSWEVMPLLKGVLSGLALGSSITILLVKDFPFHTMQAWTATPRGRPQRVKTQAVKTISQARHVSGSSKADSGLGGLAFTVSFLS